MPKGRLVFDGDNVYTQKDARIYKLKSSVSSKIDAIPGVVNSLDSTSETDALSAKMGKELQDQITELAGVGTFLSTWDCTTGLPNTNPQEDPYTYKAGNYYIVADVATGGGTNYKPHGATYTQGVASTAVETDTVSVNDWYLYDGANWVRQPAGARQITIDSALSTASTNAVENRVVTTALNGKQNTISDLSDIRSGAAAGATALQRLDNITELTNNAGYQTAGDVTNIVNNVISTVAPDGVGAGILTLQKNATTVDTFSANATQNKTINITVPTTVAELTDASDYAKKTDVSSDLADYTPTANLGAAALSNDYNDLNNKPTIPTVNNATLTIQKNSTNVATFTANSNTPTVANISVPTTVAELSDASNYATKTYADDAANGVTHSGTSAPSNPTEGMLWYDTTNDVLKTYDGSQWNVTGVIYTAGTGIDITSNTISADESVMATKTYADNAASTAAGNVNGILSGPLVPAASAQYAGRIWYCTSDNKFYECNGTTWTELGGVTGAITNNTTGTTSTISQEWVGTRAQFEALNSYGNIIYNIIE